MTNTIANKRKLTTALVALMALALSSSSQAHDLLAPVKERYECQKRDLRQAHILEGKTIRANYRDALAQAAASRRVAVKFCEPDRTLALAQIRASRLSAAECYRNDLALSKKQYRLAVAELEVWYAAARHSHSHDHVALVTTEVPRYVVKKTTTFTVPTTVTTHVPQVVGPQYIEAPSAPVVESPYYESHYYESPQFELIEPEVLNGPRYDLPTEGPIHQGPVIEGPVFPSPEPTPAIEFIPTRVNSTELRSTARPVRTKTVVRTVSRPAIVPVAYRSSVHNGHGHHDTRVGTRSLTVGDLVVDALRALAQ